MVVFAVQSVIKDPPFTRLDLLSCRNLLIYLEPELQDRLFPTFHYALRPRRPAVPVAVGKHRPAHRAVRPGRAQVEDLSRQADRGIQARRARQRADAGPKAAPARRRRLRSCVRARPRWPNWPGVRCCSPSRPPPWSRPCRARSSTCMARRAASCVRRPGTRPTTSSRWRATACNRPCARPCNRRPTRGCRRSTTSSPCAAATAKSSR